MSEDYDSEDDFDRNQNQDDLNDQRNQPIVVVDPVYDTNFKLGSRKPIYTGIMKPLGSIKASYQKVVALSDLYEFCKYGRTDLLNQFQNCNLNLVLTPGDDSLLTIAAFNGSVVCFQYLLDVGVDINYRASDGVTALMACVYAVWNDRISQIVEKLLLAGADINIVDKYGLNAIQIAYIRRNSNFLKAIATTGQLIGTTTGGPLDIGNYTVLGMKPIEYILTKVTDSSMDSILILLIENSIGELFTQIPFLIHFLARKNTPFLEQLLRNNSNSNNNNNNNNNNDNNNDNVLVDAERLLLDDDYFNSQWLFSDVQHSSAVASTILNQQLILKLDQQGLTPLDYAVKAGILGNVELLLDYGQINLNLSVFKNLFEQILIANNIEMVRLFIQYGAKFYPEREWISWYLANSTSFNQDMCNLIYHKTKFQHNLIQNKKIGRSGECTCSIFNFCIRLLLSRLLENLIFNTPISQLNSINKCNSRHCYFNTKSPVEFFLYRLSNCDYENSNMKSDVFRILLLLIQHNFITPEIINQYNWDSIYDPNIATLLEEYNLLNFRLILPNGLSLTHTRMIRKWLICHSKTMKYTPRNTEEYGTFESIVDIPHEDFCFTDSGIIWSFQNLYQYLFNVVRGVNAYDSSSPWAGEQILNSVDLNRFANTDHPFAIKIYNYMSVSKYLEFLPTSLLEQLYHIGQVFSAKGELFEQDLALILTPDELAEWADVRNFQSTNAMPKLSHDLLVKINKMKEDTMLIFFSLYTKLSCTQIDVLSQLNPELNSDTFQKLFNGEFCTMTMGSYLTKLYKSLTKWK